ncbi:MAG TPA: sigma-70 family RNA polymerase sigma factor [Albitalea sp.]|uniref:sigma-70 family RNA polymerase sigma factor n=1 Tax=Piscinibacter sp. TaxID=1903157 RepID=UPI002ED45445
MNDDFARRIFEPRRRRLLDLARGLLGTQVDAEDVVQDAYLRAHAGLPDGLLSTEAWLSAVVRHLAIDRLRRRRLEREWQAQAARDEAAEGRVAPSAEALAASAMAGQRALRLLTDTLTPMEAAAVLLREVFDADHADIARSAGKSEAACRQLVHRALQRLRTARADDDRERREDELFALCWHAIESRSPAALHALLARPPVTASATSAPAIVAAASGGHAHCTVAQIQGRFALVLMLDGKVLCALPVGPRPEGMLCNQIPF